MCAPYYMATPEEKQVDTHPKWNDKYIPQRIFQMLNQW